MLSSTLIGEAKYNGTVVIRAKLTGLAELDALLATMQAEAPYLAAEALHEEGVQLLANSLPLVPYDPNHDPVRDGPDHLRETGYVTDPEINGPIARVEVGYVKKYAMDQHERMDVQHYSTPGTGPKYLEQPLRELEAGIDARMAMFVRERLGKGVSSTYRQIAIGIGEAMVRAAATAGMYR